MIGFPTHIQQFIIKWLLHSMLCACVGLLIKVLEAFLPVGGPSDITTFIQQFDAIKIQHHWISRQESPLCFPSALEFLMGLKRKTGSVHQHLSTQTRTCKDYIEKWLLCFLCNVTLSLTKYTLIINVDEWVLGHNWHIFSNLALK